MALLDLAETMYRRTGWSQSYRVCQKSPGANDSGHTLPKKIRNAQLSQYNFILVVGDNEIAENAVAVRTRANTVEGTMPVSDFIARCVELRDTKAKDPPPPDIPEPAKGKGGGKKK